MFSVLRKHKDAFLFKTAARLVVSALSFSLVLGPSAAQAQAVLTPTILNLPAPGTMVTPSAAFMPALINGITIHPENPLEFDFIVGTGDDKLQGKAFEEESTKLIKYFLASLTVPEDEMWVNLSPYEKDRIIPEGFGTTEMGRDLLAQDYILKQLTASLMYPEKELGSEFWKKIYQKAYEEYGTTEIPVDTFNKVWIVPEKAVVYEHGNSAFVVKSHLKVMLEQDYEAEMHEGRGTRDVRRKTENDTSDVSRLTSNVSRLTPDVSKQVIKEIILPEIEREVNEGKSFANLRQIYHSAILAAWFKQNLRQTLLGQIYVDKAKTKGVDVEDKTVNQKIYAQYLEAFKKGVYNYIKEDYDPATQEIIPRKYFSGGTNLKVGDLVETYRKEESLTRPKQEIVGEYLAGLKDYNQGMVRVNLVELSEDMSVAEAWKLIQESQQHISTPARMEKAKEDVLARIKEAKELLEKLSTKINDGIVPSGVNVQTFTLLQNALEAAPLKYTDEKKKRWEERVPAASLFNIIESKNLEFRIHGMIATLNNNTNTSEKDKHEITNALNSLKKSLEKFKSFKSIIFQEANLDEQLKMVSHAFNLSEINIFYALRNAVNKGKLAQELAGILGVTAGDDLKERMTAANMIYSTGDTYILRPYFLTSPKLKKITSGISKGLLGTVEKAILDSVDVSNFVATLAWDSRKSEEEIVRFLEGQKRLSPLAGRWRAFHAQKNGEAALREAVERAKGIVGEFIKNHPTQDGEFVLAVRVASNGKSAVVTTAVQSPQGNNERGLRILLLDLSNAGAEVKVLHEPNKTQYNSPFNRIAFFDDGKAVAVGNFQRQRKWDIRDPENPRPIGWQEEETWAREPSSSPFAVDGVGKQQGVLSAVEETRDEGRETKDERPSSVRQGRSSSPVARESDWEILGVKRGDSFDTIKRAYWKLALQYHPDRNPGDKAKEDKFKDIANAYERIGKEFTEGVRERTENSDFNASASGESAGARGRSAYEAFRTPFFYSADDENDVDVVITRLSDQLRRVDNENTRLDIVRKMTALDPEGFIRVAVILMEVVFRDSSIAVSLEAMKGLHRIAGHEDPYGQETAIHALGILLDHYAKAVVNAAADALVDIGGLQKGLSWEVAIGKLSDRLDRIGMTRETIVDALARLIRDHNSDLALRLVRAKLNDENPLVRQGAEEVLERSRNAVGVTKNEDNGMDLVPSDARQGRGGEGAQGVLREAGEGVSVSVIDGTLSSDESYYGILSVVRDASAEDIRAAYRELANKLHPDHNMQIHPQMRKSLEEQFREINLAYEILSNPEARADYDFILSDGAGHPDFTGQPETTFDFASASWTSNELRGKDVYERMDIVGRMRHPKDIPILVDVLNNDPETVVRSRAADSLSRIGTREALLALTKVDIRSGYILVNFVVNAIFDSANKKNYLAIHSLVDYATKNSAALLSMIKNESHGVRSALIKSAELNSESARNMYELFKISLIYLGETEHAWPGRVDKNNPEVVRITRQVLKRSLFNSDGSVNELIAEVLKALEPEDYDDILGYYRQRLKNPADGVIRLSDAANLKRLTEPGKNGISSSPLEGEVDKLMTSLRTLHVQFQEKLDQLNQDSSGGQLLELRKIVKNMESAFDGIGSFSDANSLGIIKVIQSVFKSKMIALKKGSKANLDDLFNRYLQQFQLLELIVEQGKLKEIEMYYGAGDLIKATALLKDKKGPPTSSLAEQFPSHDLVKERFRGLHPNWYVYEQVLDRRKGESGRVGIGYHSYEHSIENAYLVYLIGEKRQYTQKQLLELVVAASLHDYHPRKAGELPQVSETLRHLRQDTELINALETLGVDINVISLLIERTNHPWTEFNARQFEGNLSKINSRDRQSVQTRAELLQLVDKAETFISLDELSFWARVSGLYKFEKESDASLREMAEGSEKFLNDLKQDPQFDRIFDDLPSWARTNLLKNEKLLEEIRLGQRSPEGSSFSTPVTGKSQGDVSGWVREWAEKTRQEDEKTWGELNRLFEGTLAGITGEDIKAVKTVLEGADHPLETALTHFEEDILRTKERTEWTHLVRGRFMSAPGVLSLLTGAGYFEARRGAAKSLQKDNNTASHGPTSSPVMTEEEATRQIEEFLKGPQKNELLSGLGFFNKEEWMPVAVGLLVELDRKKDDLDTPLNFPVPRGFFAITKRNFTTDYRVRFGANHFGVNLFVHTVIQALREKYRIRADALYQRLLSDKSFSDADLDAFIKFQAKATVASELERKDQYKLKSILTNSDISFIAHHRQRTVSILKEGSFYAGTDREKFEELQHFIVDNGTAGSDFIDATSSEDNPKWSLFQKGEELILGFRDKSRPDDLIVFDHLTMEFDWPEKIHDTDGNEFSVKDIDYVLRDKKSASPVGGGKDSGFGGLKDKMAAKAGEKIQALKKKIVAGMVVSLKDLEEVEGINYFNREDFKLLLSILAKLAMSGDEAISYQARGLYKNYYDVFDVQIYPVPQHHYRLITEIGSIRSDLKGNLVGAGAATILSANKAGKKPADKLLKMADKIFLMKTRGPGGFILWISLEKEAELATISSPVVVSPSVAGRRNNVGTFLPLQQVRSEEDWGIGDWGVMKKAVDVHAALGQNIIQLLPFNLSSAGYSPYSLASSRLMDPNYINVESLMRELKSAGISPAAAEAFIEENRPQIKALRESNKVDYAAVNRIKMTALKMIWDSFKDRQEDPLYREFEQFQEMHQNWLPEHLLYVILKNKFMSEKSNGWDWRTWDEPLRDRTPETIKEAKGAHREQLAFDAFVQFVAYRQYAQLREYADSHNVEIMVDMPYALDGADIWLNPGVFGLKKENGYKALVKQGVPPEPAYPAGQYWQFFPFDWDHPDTIPFILERFQYLQGLASQIRLDHVLGYYRKYLFTEDVEGHMTLERLGLHEKIRSLQRAANSLGTEEARRDAVKEVRELIAGALLKMREKLPEALKGHLPADAIRLTINEDGDIPDDNMLLIARRVPEDNIGEQLPEGSPWKREYVVEKAVHQNQSHWDFLRLTPNKAAADEGFLYDYLFPGDESGVQPQDSLRLGYFELMPQAEALMSEFLRLAQERGTPLIWETLGVVPSQIQKSVERLGGTNYIPVIWGEVPRWGEKRNPYYPAHHIENAFATFGLHDSTTMRNRWEMELGRETKVKMLDGFFGENQWTEEDANALTPRVHEKLLDMVYASRARIAVLTWIDLLGLGEEYRLNSPGEGGQWLNRLPREVTLENLLKAAKDEPAPEAAAEAVTLIKELTAKGGRTTQAPGVGFKIAHVIPEVGSEVIQIREVGQSFLVDAYVEGNPEKVILVLTEPDGNQERQIELQRSDDNAAWERNGLPGRWRADVPTERVGQWDFYVDARGADGQRKRSGTGRLVAVAQHADLNPLSNGYVLSPASPPVTKAGMAFIFGTGNNGTAVDENGEVYTADNSLLELGHNILYKAKLGKWVFTGKETRGDMPLKEEGDRSFEDSFSGPNLAKRFSSIDEQAKEVARRYIKEFPEGIRDVEELLTYIKKEGVLSEEEKKLREKAADALLKGITKAVGDGHSGAKTFVMSMGEEIGTALAAMMKHYYNEQWVENFVLVSGIGENFARVETDHGDIFIEAIKNGLKITLEEAQDNEEYKDLRDERIDVIVAGIKRSDMTWEREILAARLTGREIQEYAKQGEAGDNLLSVGVSVGGTKIGAGSIASDGEILRRVEVKWRDQYNESPEDVTGAVMDQIKEVLKWVDENRVKKIGIAFAGPVDKERGIVGTPFKAPNLPFENYALAQEIERRYRDWIQDKYGEDVATRVEVKVEIRNDGEAAVLGEVLSPKGMLSGETSSPVRSEKVPEEIYQIVSQKFFPLLTTLPNPLVEFPENFVADFQGQEKNNLILAYANNSYLKIQSEISVEKGQKAREKIVHDYSKSPALKKIIYKGKEYSLQEIQDQEKQLFKDTFDIMSALAYSNEGGFLYRAIKEYEWEDIKKNGYWMVQKGDNFEDHMGPMVQIYSKEEIYAGIILKIPIKGPYFAHAGMAVPRVVSVIPHFVHENEIKVSRSGEADSFMTLSEFKSRTSKGSSPMVGVGNAPGGIDLNPALLNLQIKRDGNGIPLPLPMQPIQDMHIEGFLPIIINITPVTNLPLLLGLRAEDGNATPSGGGTASGVGPVPVPDAAWKPGHSPNARLSRRRGLLVHALRV